MLSDQQIDRIADNILSTGGATFNANGLVSYLQGFQVGIAGCGQVKDMTSVQDSDVRDVLVNMILNFASKKWALIEEGFDLGAWMHEGELYLDVTRHYHDRDMASRRAVEMGEKAIWYWGTMTEIPCPNYYSGV